MSEIYPSTKALSVYNALSISGRDMGPGEIVLFLREMWDPGVDESFVETGIRFLVARGYADATGELVRLRDRNPVTRRGRPMLRAASDRELVYGAHA